MKKADISPTVSFDADQVRRENIRQILLVVRDALEERGYNAINQLAGYLISNDPAYISSHKNARSIIQYNIDEFYINSKTNRKAIRYRDKDTEGYNITPNFFIVPKVFPEKMEYDTHLSI